jgi:transcriptional regulator with XRE-family HTH domain
MAFGEKLRALRMKAGLSQEKFAEKIGVTKRTIIKYEAGQTVPPVESLTQISMFFSVSIDELVSEQDEFVAQVYADGGNRDAKYATSLVDEVSGLFAGGRLSEDDKDAVMRAIQNAYWTAKEESRRKYTPKKYRKE